MADENRDESQVRSIIDDWVKAVQEQDIDGALAHHTDGIMMFDVPFPIQSKGIDAYRATWELFFANSPGGPESFALTELAITVGGDVAFAHGLLHINESQQPVGRLTMGLRKAAGEWNIAHEHHSYPLGP